MSISIPKNLILKDSDFLLILNCIVVQRF